jgi:hypothetical protein
MRPLALLRTSVGTTVPDTSLTVREVRVDRAHLASYDRVCGFRLRDELPATYPHVLAFPATMSLMTAPGFPLPLLGLVHLTNRIELLRPLLASETFDLVVRAEQLRPHDKGTQIDLVVTGLVDGEEVWRERSTYLRRASGSSGSSSSSMPEPVAGPTFRVERRVGPDYAAVSGDRNPIHTSRILARAFGFRRPIAHGMWTKARCLAALEGRLPDAYTVDASFKLPVLLPATVTLTAKNLGAITLRDTRTGRPHLTAAVEPLD